MQRRSNSPDSSAEIAFAVYRAIQDRVTDNHALIRIDAAFRIGADDQFAARKALADIVVGFAGEFQGNPLRDPGAEALPGNAFQLEPDRVVRQTGMSVFQRQLPRQHRAGGPVGIPDREFRLNRRAVLQRGRCHIDAFTVQKPISAISSRSSSAT